MAETKKGKMVKIKIPVNSLNKEDDVAIVSLNLKSKRIKRGAWVDVPEEYAEMITECDQYAEQADEIEASMADMQL